VIEKNWSIDKSTTLKKIINEIATIIFNEVHTFIADDNGLNTKKKIADYITDALKHDDFITVEYVRADCTVAYHIAKTYGNRITFSSAFDFPVSKTMENAGSYSIKFDLDEQSICIDTSKANGIIQLYGAVNGMIESMSSFNSGTSAPAKVSELYKVMEESGFALEGDKTWTKKWQTEYGPITLHLNYKNDLTALTEQDVCAAQLITTILETLKVKS
jgi:hypothetical protein